MSRVGLAFVAGYGFVIATDQKIFLFDSKPLGKALFNQDWFKFGADFLRNAKCVKVVWGCDGVVESYAKQVKTLTKYLNEMVEQSQVCDLSKVLHADRTHFPGKR